MTLAGPLGADLSPGGWPHGAREAAEAIEAVRWSPTEAGTVRGRRGVISATVSTIALQAGLQALRLGGSAADAALTQITTQLGSVVSYAGILSCLYYEPASGRVHSLDAGFNSYRGETHPKSIPVCDLGLLRRAAAPAAASTDKGRETLVPGFMAGVQALHDRFGKLPFAALFGPAIWYADQGVTISPVLAAYFAQRAAFLARTAEGAAFMAGAGGDQPRVGDRFLQPKLAETLRQVAKHGGGYMYQGAWAEAFVAAVAGEGGKAAMEDLVAYQPIWSEPYADEVFGHTVYLCGPPNQSVFPVMAGLHLAEALELHRRGPYWRDPATLRDLSRIAAFTAGARTVMEREPGRANQAAPPPPGPLHSNSIVVVDAEGAIAVMTHTINAVIWGDTGLVIGGVPLPDSAGFQQAQLAQIRPGERLPNAIACTLTLKDAHPVLATAPVGSSLVPETLKTILSVIGQGLPLADVVAAPALLLNTDPGDYAKPLAARPVSVATGAYAADFLEAVKGLGVAVSEAPAEAAWSIRGTLACLAFAPDPSEASACEVPDVLVFAGAV